MSDVLRYGLVGLIVLLTHFQEGVTGFGCTVLALPFVLLLVGRETAVPVLVILAWLLAIFIVIESRRRIVWGEYARIAGLMGLGLPVGIWMSAHLPDEALKWILAAFMVAVGVQGLLRQRGATPASPPKLTRRTRWLLSGFPVMGGIIHGAFGSGGPLVVVYATRALAEKTLFRVTLCMVWFTMNTAMIAQFAARGALTPEVLSLVALCIPFTLLGMVMGNIAHYRMNERVFRIVVYAVLAASGLVLVWSLLKY